MRLPPVTAAKASIPSVATSIKLDRILFPPGWPGRTGSLHLQLLPQLDRKAHLVAIIVHISSPGNLPDSFLASACLSGRSSVGHSAGVDFSRLLHWMRRCAPVAGLRGSVSAASTSMCAGWIDPTCPERRLASCILGNHGPQVCTSLWFDLYSKLSTASCSNYAYFFLNQTGICGVYVLQRGNTSYSPIKKKDVLSAVPNATLWTVSS